MSKPSIKDIAKMAGVSPATVSTIVNGKTAHRRISTEVANKVLSIVKKVGYSPNQVAVSLRTGSSKIIGLLVEDISNIFYASLASIIEDELKAHGYRVVYCSTKNDPVNCVEVINMLSQRQVDGYIITPVEGIEESLLNLYNTKKPVVLIDRYFKELDLSYILVDDKKGIYDGMDHLRENGFKNIGFVTVDLKQTQMNGREKAYKEFLTSHKIPFQKNNVLKVPYRISSEKMIETIMAFVDKRKDLDALFFVTNYLTIAGIQALQRLNKRIPHDMGVLSFDDHDIFSIYPPGISAIRQPIERIGHDAVELLMDYLKAPQVHAKRVYQFIPGELIVRGSTKKR